MCFLKEFLDIDMESIPQFQALGFFHYIGCFCCCFCCFFSLPPGYSRGLSHPVRIWRQVRPYVCAEDTADGSSGVCVVMGQGYEVKA